jgi:hypothetical protein
MKSKSSLRASETNQMNRNLPNEDEVLRRMLNTPPKPNRNQIPKRRKKPLIHKGK